MVSKNGGDGPQGGLERTESVRGLLWGNNESDGVSKYRTLPGALRNCNASNESQRHNVADTYPSMSLLARVFFLQRHRCPHLMEGGIDVRMNIGSNHGDQEHLPVGLWPCSDGRASGAGALDLCPQKQSLNSRRFSRLVPQ